MIKAVPLSALRPRQSKPFKLAAALSLGSAAGLVLVGAGFGVVLAFSLP
jgi:hypothetical protein